PIQGTAADIIKIAMNNLYNELELNYDKNSEVKMLLQIHDELVFEIPDTEEKIDYYKKRITEIMENCVKFKVPMKVDCEKGYNLGNLE
ncbi:MAG: DNA polymerase, partial [Candidatus Muiribacteriota bacterium]